MRLTVPTRCGAAVAAALLLSVSGCIQFNPITDNSNTNTNQNNNPAPPQTIRIRLINATDTTLDPELFKSGEPVSVDGLFQANNKFTAFGVGTLGLLGPFGASDFSLTCEELRVLGTRGGRFGDNLNAPDGTGRQIVLTQDLNLFCDGEVTFTYSRAGDGFTTNFDVEP